MVSGPQPGSAAIAGAIGGLNVQGGMTNSMLPSSVSWSFDFEPSIGILAGRVATLGLDIRSFKEPLGRAIRQVMVPSIRKNFDSGGRPAWEPLTETTILIRSREGFGGDRPLIRTGALRRVASQINIWTVTDKSATVRGLPQKVWYGAVHQQGYESGSMKAAIKRSGGNKMSALQDIIDRQKYAMATGTTMGGRRSAPPIPQREFLMFQPEDEDDINDVFAMWLEERIDRAWSRG